MQELLCTVTGCVFALDLSLSRYEEYFSPDASLFLFMIRTSQMQTLSRSVSS